jgi:hypothetical protein
MQTKNIFRIVLATAVILIVPLLSMQFTDDVNWDISDFVTAGVLLISAGMILELVTARVNTKYRAAIGIAIAAVVGLAWVELAVGLFGMPFAGS